MRSGPSLIFYIYYITKIFLSQVNRLGVHRCPMRGSDNP
ncbi:MAG TPA: hypothetical protein [Caudoviricetes sp.]|nr:MAG TPA: hypothetical protein [Caudoviricetes sp.]